MFTKIGVKVAHGSSKKHLDFGGNPDHITLGFGFGFGFGQGCCYSYVGPNDTSRHQACFTMFV